MPLGLAFSLLQHSMLATPSDSPLTQQSLTLLTPCRIKVTRQALPGASHGGEAGK